jgi:hypothetical protein
MNEPPEGQVPSESAAPGEPETLRNTLYRKVTKGKRRLTPGRLWLYRVAVVVAWWAIQLVWKSCRIEHVSGREAAAQAVRESRSLIPVYWHQHMLFGVHALLALRPEGLKLGFLISPSIDGTAPPCSWRNRRLSCAVIHAYRYALRDYYETIVKQRFPAITPDGRAAAARICRRRDACADHGKPILPVEPPRRATRSRRGIGSNCHCHSAASRSFMGNR